MIIYNGKCTKKLKKCKKDFFEEYVIHLIIPCDTDPDSEEELLIDCRVSNNFKTQTDWVFSTHLLFGKDVIPMVLRKDFTMKGTLKAEISRNPEVYGS